ncbi:MAG: hypothetical protein QOG76_3155 [Pseudonocardiales bacterium]|nr:hypothetical protein [Pseudonocardiales bacterium]
MTNSDHQPFVNREQFRLNEAVTELMLVIRQIEYQDPTRLHLRKGEALGLVRDKTFRRTAIQCQLQPANCA